MSQDLDNPIKAFFDFEDVERLTAADIENTLEGASEEKQRILAKVLRAITIP